MIFVAEDAHGIVPVAAICGTRLFEVAADHCGDVGFVLRRIVFAFEGFVDFDEVEGHPIGFGEIEHAAFGFGERNALALGFRDDAVDDEFFGFAWGEGRHGAMIDDLSVR